jgi:hypothetical protein
VEVRGSRNVADFLVSCEIAEHFRAATASKKLQLGNSESLYKYQEHQDAGEGLVWVTTVRLQDPRVVVSYYLPPVVSLVRTGPRELSLKQRFFGGELVRGASVEN